MEKEQMPQSVRMKALMAAVPHVGISMQKQLAIAIKLMEIRDICRHYDSIKTAEMPPKDPNWRKNTVNAIMPLLSEERQQNLSKIIKIMEIQEMVANIESFKEMMEWN